MTTKHPCLETPDRLRRVDDPRDELPPRRPNALQRLLALARASADRDRPRP